jgi:hypothetical protein
MLLLLLTEPRPISQWDPTHDQQVIKELFDDFGEASKILGINDFFVQDVANANDRLQGTELGPDGRIKEWKEEFQEKQTRIIGICPISMDSIPHRKSI